MAPRILCAILLLAGWCCGQSFDAASLHRMDPGESIPGISSSGGPGTRSPDLFICKYCGLNMLIGIAFDLKSWQVAGPAILDEEHYMLTARLPAGSSKEQFRSMMERLLKERFGLTYHVIDKEMPVYVMSLAKGGAKLRAAAPVTTDEPAERRGPPEFKFDKDGLPILPDGPGLVLMSDGKNTRLRSNGETTTGLARILSDQMHGPVVDGTGLTGRYDVNLTWADDEGNPGNSPEFALAPSLAGSLSAQLGLKLDKSSEKVKVWVVDHVERTPSDL